MTTHYQKIQALGNRMAENLTIMGVPSQFDEGGLTLADKILEIRDRFTSGILLYADKKIAQTGDTVKLYSLFLNDGISQSGKTIRFIGDGLSTTVTKGESEVIDGNHFYFNSPPSGKTFTLGRTTKCILFADNSFVVFNDMDDTTYSTNGGVIRIKDKTVYYTDNNGVSQALDTGLSYLNEVRFVKNITPSFTILGYAEAVTGDDGVAGVQYSCTGSGLREFYATSGTFVSETYSLHDCKFYDDGVTGNLPAEWQVNANTTNVDRTSGEYTRLSEKTTGTNASITMTGVTLGTFCLEFDVLQEDGTSNANMIIVYDSSWNVLSTSKGTVGEWKHIKVDINDSSANSIISFSTSADSSALKYKNFEIYPI